MAGERQRAETFLGFRQSVARAGGAGGYQAERGCRAFLVE
jgi:hypothetical protein